MLPSNRISQLFQTTVRSWCEDTNCATVSSLTVIRPVCWLIQSRYDSYGSDIVCLGDQSLDILSTLRTALQFVFPCVPPVDSVIQKANGFPMGWSQWSVE